MSQPSLNPSIGRIADLQMMIAAFSKVLRVPKLPTTDRAENDIEHSFGLALTCWFMHATVAPELDLQKILMYALAHDIVELYAGDTFAFDAAAVSTKASRELASLAQTRLEWPDFPDLADYAEGYANHRDAEASFVYTIDKILPSVMVRIGEDKEFWQRHKITREVHEAEKRSKMKHSSEAIEYLEALNTWLAEPDNFYKPND